MNKQRKTGSEKIPSGIAGKLFKAMGFLFTKYIISIKKYSIASNDLEKYESNINVNGDIQISEIDKLNVVNISNDLNQLQKNKTLFRLGAGMKCFIARFGNDLAGISWISFFRGNNEGVKIKLNSNEALLLESFTFPDFRKRGVQTALIRERLFYLKKRGYNKVYVIYEPDNEFSIRALKRNGFIEYKKVLVIRILSKYFQFKRN